VGGAREKPRMDRINVNEADEEGGSLGDEDILVLPGFRVIHNEFGRSQLAKSTTFINFTQASLLPYPEHINFLHRTKDMHDTMEGPFP